jgi:hypothetical protein
MNSKVILTIAAILIACILQTILSQSTCTPNNCNSGDRCCAVGIFNNATAVCYNPHNAQCALCSRRSSQLCGVNDRCCNLDCYNPVSHTCTGGALCPINLKRCGAACYSPSVYKCDENNQLVLLPTNSKDSCEGASNNQCGSGELCCPNEIKNQLCFNPSTSYCCTAFDVNAIRPKVCQKGQTCCLVFNGQVADNVCYDPNTHYCDMSLQKVVSL